MALLQRCEALTTLFYDHESLEFEADFFERIGVVLWLEERNCGKNLQILTKLWGGGW